MSLTSLVRRSVALTAATALASGVLATGGLAAPAQALDHVAATVTKVSPSSWDNRSSVSLTLTGTNFSPSDTVIFRPACSDDPADPVPLNAPCALLTGPEVGDLTFAADPALPGDTQLTVEADFAMAPPGRYHVIVEHDLNSVSSTPFSYFKVFTYGGGNATSTIVGVGDSSIDPRGVDCTTQVFGDGCGRSGALPLDVKGSNFAIGAAVEFVKEVAGEPTTPDAGLPFTPGNPSNGRNGQGTADNTGYPSAGLIQGSYDTVLTDTQTNAFTPGWHQVRVVNTDGKTTGTRSRFAQPYFAPTGSLSFPTAANPSPAPSDTIGQGAKNKVLRITGQGFRAGSTLFVERKSTNTCADVTVGATTLGGLQADGLYTTIEAPLSFADCSSPNLTARQIGVVSGLDGARFFRNAFLKIGGFPVFSSFEQAQYATLGQGAHEGFDGPATSGILVFGSNFIGSGETDAAKMTSFSFGPGVTATTRQVNPTGTSAFISIDVDPEAGTGERAVTATNPDGGSSTNDCERIETGDCDPTGDGPLFQITVGPKVTKVEIDASGASSMTPGQENPTKYNVTGSGFQASGYSAGDQLIVALPGQTTQDPNIELLAIQRTSATALIFQAKALSAATAGPRDLILENDDHGRVVCEDCLGIDSLAIDPKTAPNSGVSPSIGLTVLTDGLPPLTSASTVKLTHQTATGQTVINGTMGTPTDAKHGSATFPLASAALGRYNMTVVLDPASGTPKTVSCTGCFTVTGTAFALDGTTPVTPNKGAQGVQNWKLTFKGTGFTQGMTVSIVDVTVHDVTYVNATEITALVDIANDAETGAKAGTVTAGDGTTKPFTFTVTEAPTVTAGSVSPAAYGAGAGSPGSPTPVPPLGVGGNGFAEDPDTQVTLGTGIVVADEVVEPGTDPECLPILGCSGGTDDTVSGKVSIAQSAALGKRAVTVTNPGDGGSATLADAFTVNPGPKITTIANAKGQPVLCRAAAGCTNPQSITVLGSDFPAPTTDGDKAEAFKLLDTDGSAAEGVTVSNIVFAPGKITADVTVAGTRAYGPLRAAVYKATDKGYGTCDTCLVVASVPGTAGPLTLAVGGSSLRVGWRTATANGSAVTTYRLVAKRGTTVVRTVDATATTRSYTFSGLTNGVTHTISVAAVNAAGLGPASSISGIPGLISKMTSVQSTRVVSYGGTVTYSGKLTNSAGTGLGGKAIRIAFYPTAGRSFVQTVTTAPSGSSTGTWRFVYKPAVPTSTSSRTSPYNVKVYASFLGDTTYRKVIPAGLYTYVAPKITKSSPANGARTSATTTLRIAGAVAPSKAGRYVYLYRYTSSGRTLLARTTLSSSSTYLFSIKPARGTYTLRVYIPTTYTRLSNGKLVELNTSAFLSFVHYRT